MISSLPIWWLWQGRVWFNKRKQGKQCLIRNSTIQFSKFNLTSLYISQLHVWLGQQRKTIEEVVNSVSVNFFLFCWWVCCKTNIWMFISTRNTVIIVAAGTTARHINIKLNLSNRIMWNTDGSLLCGVWVLLIELCRAVSEQLGANIRHRIALYHHHHRGDLSTRCLIFSQAPQKLVHSLLAAIFHCKL